jgi:kynurenine formamidase
MNAHAKTLLDSPYGRSEMREFLFVASPLRNSGGTASPLRLFALV